MKKLLNVLLILAVMFTNLIPSSVFAATKNENGTLTIKKEKTTNDVSYELYRLFDVEYDETKNTQIYFLNEKYASLFEENGPLASYVTLSDKPTNEGRTYVKEVTFSTDEETRAFTKDALEAVKNMDADATASIAANETSTTLKGLVYGYWLLDSSLGAIVSIDTYMPTQSICDKNEEPDIDKVIGSGVKIDSEYSVGQEVPYTITVKIKAGAEDYVVTDKMQIGLELVSGSIEVKVEGETNSATAGKDYTLTENKNGFVIDFSDDFEAETKTVKITYKGLINADAVTVDTVNNKATLNFGDDHKVESEDTTNMLYRFAINKTADDESQTVLAGAHFKLYTANTGGKEIKVIKDETAGVYRPVVGNEVAEEIVTDENGYAEVRGLATGKYYVEETEAPEDYVRLTTRVEVTIEKQDKDSVITTGVNQVINTKSVLLPSTGGMGTVLFMTVGSIMALGFGVNLVTKARMRKIED